MVRQLYRHNGSAKLLPELFNPIKNRELNVKPSGGLWASPMRDDADTWEGFLNYEQMSKESGMSAPDYFDFSLKDNAKVLYINSKQDLDALPLYKSFVTAFLPSSFNNVFTFLDFEQLSKKYDAIEVNISKDVGLREALYGWDVDSLLVFNKDAISIEKSFIKFPEAFQSISNIFGVNQDYLSVHDGQIIFQDGTHKFAVAEVNAQGKITDRLSLKDFQEEMAGLGEAKRQARNQNAAQAQISTQMHFNIKDGHNSWMLPLELRSNLDGSGFIYLLHGNKPIIAFLKPNGHIAGFANKNKVIKEALCAELTVLEKIEHELKSPKDLTSVSFEQIESLANQYQGVDEKDFVSTELLLGLMIHDSSFSSFPSAEKRINSLDFEDLIKKGSHAQRCAQEAHINRGIESIDIDRD